MPGLSVTARIGAPDPPDQAFERLASGHLLDFDCDRMVVGSAVSIRLPVGAGEPGAAGAPITLLGHIAAVKYGRSVLVVHHQPWRGRLMVRFFPDGRGTRIVLESSLDEDGLAWLAGKRGFDPPVAPRSDRHRIGLLVSKSGSAAVFAQATESLAALAVDDVNADGGIGGTPVELLVGDDASDSLMGSNAAMRLYRSGCRVIFACVTSATFNAAVSALQDTDVMVIHTVLNEGGPPNPRTVRLGERPLEQVRAGVPAVMRDTGAVRWFFVGHRYSWSYGAHWAARRVVAENGGSVVGERYVSLGSTDFSTTLDAIEASGAELILSSLVGHDEVFFERQCARQGLRSHTRTLALVLDEATQQLIGDTDADGVWAAFGYFQGFDDTHSDLETRYRSGAQGLTPPLSSLSETTYEAIIAYARAATMSAAGDSAAIRGRLIAGAGTDQEGAAPARRRILLAESRHGTLRQL
ncbi:ABC transporter substrate-binding protein [Williamsia sterculiae]|uniref:ABC-type branched-chain amino acid transport system, substrate-binding protein n=1 Tax=Williamsia sterculiae TaxID=1344003 RepID=A0A1N7H228_9NOCA|nr:ABC transporter substrate-binding protein [Williamsia sterculiae]SIS18873.1 ABC-type branched-chain amino acid transport system, substrate-binding protein [Williamsia sterculiae]